ncbi:MAG: hypothetical protein MJ224_00260 [archaeon]|nr:hypothetical protein [archaeon]
MSNSGLYKRMKSASRDYDIAEERQTYLTGYIFKKQLQNQANDAEIRYHEARQELFNRQDKKRQRKNKR